MHSCQILLAGIDGSLRAVAARRLETEGCQVLKADDLARALFLLETGTVDAILLGSAGAGPRLEQPIRALRRLTDAPLLIVGADPAEHAVISSLEAGADDYLAAPVRVDEMVARVRALVRRSRRIAPPPDDRPLRYGKIALSERTHDVRIEDRRVRLTPTEFRMLLQLIRRRGSVMSREALLEAVWGYTGYDENLINTHIRRLRAKVEDDPHRPQIILTVRGFGYRLAGPD
jgi:two-component system response regulator MtrA